MKYQNVKKTNWRNWAWNRISESVIPGSRVLVLCGESAGDLNVGRRKGFEVAGVDKMKACVNTFRSKGGCAIHDEVENQIRFLGSDAVILDEMCGITNKSESRYLSASLYCGFTVGNYLRGRDRLGADLANMVKRNDWVFPSLDGNNVTLVEQTKHRGMLMFLLRNVTCLLNIKYEQAGVIDQESLSRSIFEMQFFPGFSDLVQDSIFEMFEIYRPKWFSYKSEDSSQHFDSIAIKTNGKPEKMGGVESLSDRLYKRNNPKKYKSIQSSKRKAAAAKAVLTKRRVLN